MTEKRGRSDVSGATETEAVLGENYSQLYSTGSKAIYENINLQ